MQCNVCVEFLPALYNGFSFSCLQRDLFGAVSSLVFTWQPIVLKITIFTMQMHFSPSMSGYQKQLFLIHWYIHTKNHKYINYSCLTLEMQLLKAIKWDQNHLRLFNPPTNPARWKTKKMSSEIGFPTLTSDSFLNQDSHE